MAEAEASKAVLQDAIAHVAGVATEAVTILSVASARRRLQEGGVVVAYKIESNDFAEAADAADKLQAAADDPSVVDTAIEEAAKDANAEAVFAGVSTESLTYDVVAATDAPTVAPTTYWDNKKKRKEDTRLLIVIIVCAVAGCCCLAALSMACFAKHKKSPEPPPIKAPPISLGGVDVDVAEELLCSPRRARMVYAPLAAWYNAPERAALRAKHGPLPLSPDAFRKWPAMNLVTMAFLDDQGVPPAF